ncbi:MAG TPA: transglutaminase domain-containing protein [bacterium]|nr:transglutaminase domain-containing protein [bacterium]
MNPTVYKTPPLYLGALFLFWGFGVDMPTLGVMAAIAVEGNYLMRRKWDLTRDDFIRVSDISSFVMLASLLLIYLNYEPWQIMRQFIIWLPIIHLPLLLTQLYSTSDRIVIGTRLGGKKSGRVHAHRPFNITWVYAALMLFSAAAGNNREPWFFAGVGLFLIWVVLIYRGRRYSIALFAAVTTLILILSLVTAVSLNNAYLYTQDRIMEYYQLWFARFYADPFKTDTALGDITRLKLSSRIIMRVIPDDGPGAPYYLTDGVFDTYSFTAWYNRDGRSRQVIIEENDIWQLHETPSDGFSELSVVTWLPKKKGVIPLPTGTFSIARLNAAGLKELALGPVLVEEGPELLDYTARYRAGTDLSAPPGPRDTLVPNDELSGLDRTLAEILPMAHTPAAFAEAVERFFLMNFTYALDAKPYGKEATPLANFLLQHRRGHCEYFAAATVLLFRRVGIPARYKTGYMVDEWSELENAYVVRERHGHAWTTAWIDGKWVDIDTTPPGWSESEALNAGFFEPLQDLLGYLRVQYERFRQAKSQRLNNALFAGIVLLSGWLLYRIYARRKRQNAQPESAADAFRFDTPGKDSPFHAVAALLATIGIERLGYETYGRWAARIDEVRRGRGETATSFVDDEFSDLVVLHERYRFDPQGLATPEKERFIASAAAWLEHHRPK